MKIHKLFSMEIKILVSLLAFLVFSLSFNCLSANNLSFKPEALKKNVKDVVFEQYKDSLADKKTKSRAEYDKIIDYFTLLSNKGNAEAKCELAKLYIAGNGVIRNYKKAVEFLNEAAALGSSDALYQLSKLYESAKGVARDNKKSINLLNESAEKGNALASYELFNLYFSGKGVLKDNKKAIEFLIKSADQDNIDALYKLGIFYSKGGVVDKDLTKATKYLTKAVVLGHKKAQVELDRVSAELKKFFSNQVKLAKSGNLDAYFRLGKCYEEGIGVEQDYYIAWTNYRLALNSNHKASMFKAYEIEEKFLEPKKKFLENLKLYGEKGNADSLHDLGVYYMENEIDKDENKAFEYFKKAAAKGRKYTDFDHLYSRSFFYDKKLADKGDPDALLRMGIRYFLANNNNLPFDVYAKEFEYYKKAAEAGNHMAYIQLGRMYSKGLGLSQDFDKALECYQKADRYNKSYTASLRLPQSGNGFHEYHRTLVLKNNLKYKESFYADLELAEKGDADAMYRVGYCCRYYYFPETHSNDRRKYTCARLYFKEAAELGHPDAMYELVNIPHYPVFPDSKRVSYLEKSAKSGNTDAMVSLAGHFSRLKRENFEDKTLRKFYQEKIDYYMITAAELGNIVAQVTAQHPDKITINQKLIDFGDSMGYYRLGMDYHSRGCIASNEKRREDEAMFFEKAFNHFKIAADNGHIESQLLVAEYYYKGRGVAKDDSKAFEYYKKAYNYHQIAYFYYKGIGVAKNASKAFEYFEKAYNYPNYTIMAEIYLREKELSKYYYERGYLYYKKALKDLDDNIKSGEDFRNAQKQKDDLLRYAEDLKGVFLEQEKLANQDNADAQFEVAIAYEFGRGVSQNDNKALAYYIKSIKGGNLDALYFLAQFYEEKMKDYSNALKYYEKAANNGNKNANYKLARLYEQGKGIMKNYAKAFECYKYLADDGNIEVLYKLGDFYREGKGVAKDEDKAFECYRKFFLHYEKLQRVDVDASFKIACCYADGKGVKKDESLALSFVCNSITSRRLEVLRLMEIDIYTQYSMEEASNKYPKNFILKFNKNKNDCIGYWHTFSF